MTWIKIAESKFPRLPKPDRRVLITVRFANKRFDDQVMVGKICISPRDFPDGAKRASGPLVPIWFNDEGVRLGPNEVTAWQLLPPAFGLPQPTPHRPPTEMDSAMDTWADAIVDGRQGGDGR